MFLSNRCASLQSLFTLLQRNAAHFSQFLSAMNTINAVFYNQYLKGNAEKTPDSNIYYGIRINRAQEMSFIR